MTEPIIRTTGTADIDASRVVEISPEELRQRWLQHNTGRHVWSIAVIHFLDNPETALDHMELRNESLMGFTAINCLFCHTEYQSGIRLAHCTGKR